MLDFDNEKIHQMILLAHQGDCNAREQLIVQNIPFVYYLVSHHFDSKNTYDDFDDFISLGMIGLVKAVDGFDESRNVSFQKFAKRCIFNEILMHLRKWKNWNSHISLQEPIYENKFSENPSTLEEFVPNDGDFIEALLEEYDIQNIMQCFAILNHNEKIILKAYFGIGTERLNQVAISHKYNLSQSYISRIIRRSIKKLQVAYFQNEQNYSRKKSQVV